MTLHSPLRVVLSVCAVAVLSAACDDVASPTPSEPTLAPTVDEARAGPLRSIVFVNGNVITMDPVTRVEEAVAIRGTRIVRTGSTEELLRHAGPRSVIVDLEGKTLMPGFVDAHSHEFQSSPRSDWDAVQDRVIRLGTTTLGEPTVFENQLHDYQDWAGAGNLKVRLNLYLIAGKDYCGTPVDDWWKSYEPRRHPNDRLWVAGLKSFSDGGVCGQPAVSLEFAEGTGFGDLYTTADEVADLVAEAEALGYQMIIHALGDRSLDEVLDGYEQALGNGANRLRHRIEHNNLIRPDQLARYSEIGVIPVVFGHWLSGHLELQFLPGGPQGCPPFPRNDFYQTAEAPLRQLIDANPGLPVAWHNDNPWWPPSSPLSDLHNLTTRRQRFTADLICEPPSWAAGTAVTVEEALTMMTVNAAYALGREHDVGRLAPGMAADLILLPDNPLTMDPRDLWQLRVGMTLIDGKVEFCQEGMEAYCPRG